MNDYKGQCHCGAVKFSFKAETIEEGLRCNCSICRRKGTLMSSFVLSSDELNREIQNNKLSTYQFGSQVAKHHFCNECGIYTFHETLRKPGHFRVNLGCVEGVDTYSLKFDVFDGASL